MTYQLEKQVADRLKAFFEPFDFIDKIVIFGSRAKHNANPKSDIDLCIYSLEMSDAQFSKLKLSLDELPILYAIDIVHFEKSNEALRENIARDGKLLFAKQVKLTAICQPKQHQTISKKDMSDNGKYLLYGANGVIGKTDKYTHENEALLITCRGATCGTLNISKPMSYVNGNAMALDKLSDKVSLKYLYYYLLQRRLDDVITGSAQPQITKENLEKVNVYLPSLTKQKEIAQTLDKASELIELRKASIEKLDELAQSTFIDMFGDPVLNPKNYKEKTIFKMGHVQTGNTPPRAESDNYGDFIEWIKSDNIFKNKLYMSEAKEYLSQKGYGKARLVPSNSLLFICIAGSMSSIGNLAITNKEVAFNQQINSLTPKEDNVKYLYYLFKLTKKYFEESSTKSMKIMINKTTFQNLSFPIAPLAEQNQFAKTIEKIESQKSLYEAELTKLQATFDALLSQSFEG